MSPKKRVEAIPISSGGSNWAFKWWFKCSHLNHLNPILFTLWSSRLSDLDDSVCTGGRYPNYPGTGGISQVGVCSNWFRRQKLRGIKGWRDLQDTKTSFRAETFDKGSIGKERKVHKVWGSTEIKPLTSLGFAKLGLSYDSSTNLGPVVPPYPWESEHASALGSCVRILNWSFLPFSAPGRSFLPFHLSQKFFFSLAHHPDSGGFFSVDSCGFDSCGWSGCLLPGAQALC